MTKVSIEYISDQRRLTSHIIILIIPLIIIGLTIIFNADYKSLHKYLWMFLVIFTQVEIFVFLGVRIFRDFNPAATPGKITRLVLMRFLFFLIACFISAIIIILIARFIDGALNSYDSHRIINDFFKYEFKGWFKSTALGLTLGGIIFIFTLWQQALRNEQKLREEKLIFQNETLKNQVNPHFLFNSLNTISSLIQSDPASAEKFINNLSSVYRYILENGNKDRVSLQSELEFIYVYFNLFRIRDEEKIFLDVKIGRAEIYEILPVSLQILLENAIKHNSATRENPLKIFIYMEDHVIVVRNNLQRKATQLKSTGIGLKNLAERIRMITGKELIMEQTHSEFIVKLPLIS